LFWAQCPLAIVSGTTLFLSIPAGLSASPAKQRDIDGDKSILRRLADVDYLGATLLILTIVSLLYGLSTPTISYVPIAISIAIFPLFLAQEIYRHPDPIIPISVLRSRGALFSCLATLGFMMSRWAVLFYTPIFATAVRGWSPAQAGSILVPTNTGFALGSLLSGVVHIRRAGSFYFASLVIFAIFPATLLALALVCNAGTPTWLVVLCTFSNGLCAGAALNYTLHHVLHLVLPEVRFIVTSLIATFRGFAGTFGSAIGGGIFVRVLRRSLVQGFKENGVDGREPLIRQLLGSPRAVQKLEGVEKEVAVQAYTDAIRVLFLAGMGLAIGMFFVQASTGWKAPQAPVYSTLVEEQDERLEYSDEEDARGSPERNEQEDSIRRPETQW
jgi:hypothetical protein